MTIAVILAILFGPLGLLYATISGGLIMIVGVISIVISASLSDPTWFFDSASLESTELFSGTDVFLFVCYLTSIVLSVLAVRNHNKQILSAND